jgi:hypothetical protein
MRSVFRGERLRRDPVGRLRHPVSTLAPTPTTTITGQNAA